MHRGRRERRSTGTAAAVMGLLIDAMRKIESRAIGEVPVMSTEPTTCTSTRSP